MEPQTEKSKTEPSPTQSKDEEQIRRLIEGVVEAVSYRDIDAILAAYSPEAVIYDVRDSLQYLAHEGLRKSWEECFESAREFKIQPFHPEIHVQGDIAFSYFLSHATGRAKGGEGIDIWLRMTTCYRKINDQWLVVHEHGSAPGDFSTGKILQHLKPEKTAAAH